MKKDIYAYYFPNWHVDERNEKWHGKGWTEWEVLKCARPRFDGHELPVVPLWGYEDESVPRVMEKKINIAKEYGIDGFIFDTYYFDDGPYRERCLDSFLAAKNCNKLKFTVMWCNHDSIYAHPSPRNVVAPVLKSGRVSEDEFVALTDVFIEKYFKRENYTRIDGKIFFIIYNVDRLCKDFGGRAETKRILSDLRERVREAGLGEMVLGCHLPEIKSVQGREEVNAFLRELGIDEGVRYWWPSRHADDPRFKEYALTVDYKDYVEAGLCVTRRDTEFFEIPVNATVVNGLDNSPRTIQSETYENLETYPWQPIVVHRSPALFEGALRKIKEFAESELYTGHLITLTSWNEWTEGNYLEPDDRNGYGYLEAVKKVFGNKENA